MCLHLTDKGIEPGDYLLMIRQATTTEIEFYEKVLYSLQDQVLQLIQDERLYLTGDTCLSRFYYHHRFSDDLDFFFDGYAYPKEVFEIAVRDVANRISEQFEIEMTINGEYFKRFFVSHHQQQLKIEFIYENYKTVGTRQKIHDVMIDSKENLATNKLTAVYDRKTVKDFVDLYFLLDEIAFEKAAEWAKYKIVPLDYEGLVITFSDRRLEGEVLLTHPLSEHQFNDFVNTLIGKIFEYAKRRQ